MKYTFLTRRWMVAGLLLLVLGIAGGASLPLQAAARTDPFAEPLDPGIQAAALLPAFRTDLDAAPQWNRYTLNATIDPEARTIDGDLRLEYTNRGAVPLNRVYFYLFPNLPDFGGRLAINRATIDGRPATIRYAASRFLLRLDLPYPLPPGERTTVMLNFSARAPLDGSQRYYAAFNRERGVLALASALPMVARLVGDTWDLAVPSSRGDFVTSETALYDVTLTVPADWNAVTTGVAIASNVAETRRTARFVSGPQRDFTIMLTRFQSVSTEVAGTRVTVYHRPESADGARAALDSAANALRAFNRRFGSYPLAELDVVQIDARKFLGVEYPGLIMIDRKLFDGDPKRLEIIVAHEVGHQWWYSQVGNDVQGEAWLDEGLTSFAQVVYQEEMYGAAAGMREIDGFRVTYTRARDARRDAPLKRPASALRGNYTAIVYAKGALFFQALRVKIGETAFDRFLHDYYAGFRYRMATSEDLLATAEISCACQLDDFYRDWVTTAAPVAVP